MCSKKANFGYNREYAVIFSCAEIPYCLLMAVEQISQDWILPAKCILACTMPLELMGNNFPATKTLSRSLYIFQHSFSRLY